jgi:hypothetical protein
MVEQLAGLQTTVKSKTQHSIKTPLMMVELSTGQVKMVQLLIQDSTKTLQKEAVQSMLFQI